MSAMAKIRGGFSVATVRYVLAAIVVVDLLWFLSHLADARAAALARGEVLGPFSTVISTPAVMGVISITAVVAAIAFGRRPGRLGEGLLALLALGLFSTAHAHLFGSPWRHMYYSGLCLAGWLVGLAVSRRSQRPEDESYARIGSMALLGTAYLNAGISKLVYGGIVWLSGLPIQAVILGQDGLVADGVLSIYRSWVATTPAFAALFSIMTVALELAGPLMLVGRRTRLIVALGLFAMHTNIWLLTPILYFQSMIFLLLYGLSADEPRPMAAPRVALLTNDRRFASAAMVLTIAGLLGIAHQGRRYAASLAFEASWPGPPTPAATANEVSPGVAVTTASAPATPTVRLIREIGPLTIGQSLADDWTVDSFGLSDSGFLVTLAQDTRRAHFEVTCAQSEHVSPFDLGAAHIFYETNLAFHELQGAGRALRGRIESATRGHDVCESVGKWRAMAQIPR